MPGKDGKLSPKEKKKIIDWLTEKTVDDTCPICQQNDWFVADELVSPLVYSEAGTIIGGPTFPQALVVCTNCFYARNFMAVPIGVAQGEEEKGGGDNG